MYMFSSFCSRSFNQSELDDILCTPEEVEHLLLGIDVSKANGPDLVSARMLKNTATSIALLLQTCLTYHCVMALFLNVGSIL